MNEQIEKLLKEVEELKENQKKMTKKMDKMQQNNLMDLHIHYQF